MKNILALILLFFSYTIYSQSGRVIKIKDGDTIIVIDSLNNQTTLRLAEVDCPESGQPFGRNAKIFTAEQVGMESVTYEVVSTDRYGRIIAKVFFNGKYLSREIIKNGYGWHYKRYSNSKELAELEIVARKDSLGLWQDKNAIAPWEYRKSN